MGFTQAHSSDMPSGSTDTGFTLTQGPHFGTFGFTGLGANGFVACPTVNGTFPYQIFANVAGGNFVNCLGFDALTSNYTEGAAAYQYI